MATPLAKVAAHAAPVTARAVVVAQTAVASQTQVDASGQADELRGRLLRTVVQEAPSSVPGRRIVQVRTLIPVGVESGWHTHPGEEIGYILAGTVEMSVAGRASRVLRAGDGFLIPPGVPHNALDLGPDTGRMLSTYLVDPDAPLSTFVDPPAGTAVEASATEASVTAHREPQPTEGAAS